MQDLLQTYSTNEILIVLVMSAMAIKGIISFYDWAKARIRQVFNEEVEQESEMDEVRHRLDQGGEIMQGLESNQKALAETINGLNDKVELLIDSNKDDIKAFLTKEHHYYCYQVGWIDDYSLECCERRFEHYQKEGGNTFIAGFMEDLRKLPHQPPENIKLDK